MVGRSRSSQVESPQPDQRPSEPGRAIAPFLIGTAVGGLVGAVAGTLLSDSTRRLLIWLIHLVDRRLTDAERDRLRFELLLQ